MSRRSSSIIWILALVTALWSALPAGAKNDGSTGKGGGSATAPQSSHGSYPNSDDHPSGQDRSAEHGGSGQQGKAESNPDDTKGPQRWEGTTQEDDKPGGEGGWDLADQDGNNGCGNDDDFDDDNNGHCGGNDEAGNAYGLLPDEVRGAEAVVTPIASGGSLPESAGPVPAEVLGVTIVQGGEGVGEQQEAPLAARVSRPGALPFTGSELTPFALIGLMLILAGWGITRGAASRS